MEEGNRYSADREGIQGVGPFEKEPADASVLDDLAMDEALRRHAAMLKSGQNASGETAVASPDQFAQIEETLPSE